MTRAQRLTLMAGLVLLAVMPLLFPSAYSLNLLTQTVVAILICLSYQVLLSQGGLLSFGHAIFTGLGAYVVVHGLNARFGAGLDQWWFVILLPLMAGAVAAAVGFMLGWLATGRPGTAFAMITLGLGELVWAAAWMFPEWSGGEAGLSANRVVGAAPLGFTLAQPWHLYTLASAYLCAAVWLLLRFTQTPVGLMLKAARDQVNRIGFLGYDARVIRLIAFTLASCLAGTAGGLTALNFEFVSVDSFSLQRSGAAMLFTVVGGSALIGGAVVGGVLMVAAMVILSTYTPAWLLYVGLLFVWVVMRVPGGLSGMQWWAGLRWRSLPAFAGLVLGAIVLIEMTYHWVTEVGAGMPPELALLGLRVDVSQAAHWWLAACVTAVSIWVLSAQSQSREGVKT